jgi:cytidylate kinase
LIITIDGPAASGKSTAARLLAGKLDAAFLDTGAMYRAVTLAAIRAGADLHDEQSLLGVLQSTRFEFVAGPDAMTVRINGTDVTEQIRDPHITANARHAASSQKVRARLVQMQREFAACQEMVVTEGRDQGTVAFPGADVKFYLTAEPAERARRRQAELGTEGPEDLDQIERAIEARDKSDRSKEAGHLRPAEDALVIDSTNLTIEEVVEELFVLVKQKCLSKD